MANSSKTTGGGAQGQTPPDAERAAKAFTEAMAKGAMFQPWMEHADTDKFGNPTGSLRNLLAILEGDPAWRGVIALDQFGARVMKLKAPPYAPGETGEWSDLDDTRLRVWLATTYRIKAEKRDIQDAIASVADRNRYNEVTAWLDSLKWDRRPRLRRWLFTYCNADDALADDELKDRQAVRYLEKVGIRTLVAAVARAYSPGCKVDTMTVLEGPQGQLKSTVWRVLGGDWFTDAYLDLSNKDAFAVIQGMWFIEWSELESLTRAETSTVKRFLSTATDRYRSWYGHRAGNVPRTCVCVGTTNAEEYLKDIENRRIWPVRCGRIDIAGLRRDRAQLFAEAVHWYRRGMSWWARPRERKLFERQQERRYLYDALQDRVAIYLKGRARVTTAEVMGDGLELDSSRWTLADQQRVGRVLLRLGWVRKQSGRARWYEPGEDIG